MIGILNPYFTSFNVVLPDVSLKGKIDLYVYFLKYIFVLQPYFAGEFSKMTLILSMNFTIIIVTFVYIKIVM